MTPSIRFWRRAAQTGTASIEFAILAPIFFVMVIGSADFGMFVAQQSWLAAAARIGSEYATRINPGCITVTHSGVVLCEAASTFVDDYTTLPGVPVIIPYGSQQVCTCADGDPNVLASQVTPCPPTGSNPCNVGGDTRVFEYQTVSVGIGRYKPMFGFDWNMGRSFTASSTMRSQ